MALFACIVPSFSSQLLCNLYFHWKGAPPYKACKPRRTSRPSFSLYRLDPWKWPTLSVFSIWRQRVCDSVDLSTQFIINRKWSVTGLEEGLFSCQFWGCKGWVRVYARVNKHTRYRTFPNTRCTFIFKSLNPKLGWTLKDIPCFFNVLFFSLIVMIAQYVLLSGMNIEHDGTVLLLI